MARDSREPQVVATTGTVLTFYTITSDGVAIPFDGESWFDIKNDSGGALTPNVSANFSSEGVALGVKSLGSFADGAIKTFRPWKSREFRQENGELWINGAGLKIAVYRK